ncbi:hypothetical protein [Janibacter sp. GXQ6167]|uniref:hypothetical protein n=1 Tax=Janibacter sp. GXQ6167 TaxID=3240791 RepID=UPI00352465AE
MSEIVIIAARRPVAVEFTAILRDWSALQLIERTLVVDLDAGDVADPRRPVVVIESGVIQTGLLQELLTEDSYARARLCVVSRIDEPTSAVPHGLLSSILNEVRVSLPTAALVQAHVLTGGPNDAWGDVVEPLPGWHTLALSPEQSSAPDQGAAPLFRSAADPRWLLHVVGSVCTLLGQWRGQDGSVLDDRSAPSGGAIVPFRAFSRSLRADAVESVLRARLLDVGARYPAPRVDTTAAVVIDDEEQAAVGMADDLLRKHYDVLPRQRIFPKRPPAERIGVFEALKQFFRFLLNALKNAPRHLADSLVRATAAKTAGAVQSVVFGGADAGFTVVVKGVRSDGSLASWSEFESGLESVMERSAPSAQMAAPPQKQELWQDFVGAGMTLLDAGRRGSDDLGPRMVGAQRAVIVTTDRVAPAAKERFTLPAHIASHLPSWELEVGDDIAGWRLFERLVALRTSHPHLATDITAQLQRLKAWSAESRSTYVGRVGHRFGESFRATISEVDELNRKIEALQASAGLPDELGEQQERLARRVRLFSVISWLFVALFLGLAVGGVITWLWSIALMFLSVLTWIVGGTLIYMRGQAQLFRYLHRRGQTATELETARQHRLEALEDLRRLSRAYRQYLDWSRAFRAFVHAPLGRVQAEAVPELLAGQGMPRNFGLGEAVPDPEVVEEVANRWKDRLFRTEWLSGCWSEFQSEYPNELGDLRYALRRQGPSLLLQDPNLDGQGPVLTRWSHAVAKAAERRAPSRDFLARVAELTESDTQDRDRLLDAVRICDHQTGEPVERNRASFVGGLDQVRGDAGPTTFLDVMFSPTKTALDALSVRESISRTQYQGLTMATTVVQLGEALQPDQFRSGKPPSDGYGPPDPPPTGPTFV